MRATLQPVSKSIGVSGASSIIFTGISKAAHKRPIRRLSFKPGTKTISTSVLISPRTGNYLLDKARMLPIVDLLQKRSVLALINVGTDARRQAARTAAIRGTCAAIL